MSKNNGLERLCSCRHELRALSKASPAERRTIINEADGKLIHCLGELSHNVLCGNLGLPVGKFAKLKRYRRALRDLADRKLSINRKKDMLLSNNQSGGFLPILASLAAPLITGLLGSIIQR